MTSVKKQQPKTIEEVLQQYPRLTAHLISESLGYFTPRSAAQAILAYVQNRAYACEWYVHCAQSWSDEKLMETNRRALELSFKYRHHHSGAMRNIEYARKLVDRVRDGGKDPAGASWF
jgi:hypothetical protein